MLESTHPSKIFTAQDDDRIREAQINTLVVSERAKQESTLQRAALLKAAAWSRYCLLGIAGLTATMGLSDALLPDDPSILTQFPLWMSVLTAHEGDPIQMLATAVGMLAVGNFFNLNRRETKKLPDSKSPQ